MKNLSNDIIYEIFDYLDGYDIYHTFVGLNSRFQQILLSLRYPLKFDLSNIPILSLRVYEKLVVTLRQRIISLSLQRLVTRAGTIFINSSFEYLQSLTLNLNSYYEMDYLSKLSTLPCLYALTLYLKSHLKYALFWQIFRLSHLKYAKISSDLQLKYVGIFLPLTENMNSSIERLIIDHNCTLKLLYIYLSYTPRLQRLICKRKIIDTYTFYPSNLYHQSVLTHVYIHDSVILFNRFEMLIKKISSQLQVIHLSTTHYHTYFNTKRWEQLICQYLPQLSRLEMKYNDSLMGEFRPLWYHQSIVRFSSPFWIERQWILYLKVVIVGGHQLNRGTITYSLLPYKADQTDCFIHRNTFTTNQLIFVSLASLKSTELYILKMKPVLTPFSITRLILPNYGVSIRILFRLLQILVHLNSLMISSFISKERRNVRNIPENIRRHSKITQVYIEQINSTKDIEFVLNLCPQMDSFEIDQISRDFFQDFLQLFPIRQSTQYNLAFSFRNFQLDDEIIQQLNKKNSSFTHSWINSCLRIHSL